MEKTKLKKRLMFKKSNERIYFYGAINPETNKPMGKYFEIQPFQEFIFWLMVASIIILSMTVLPIVMKAWRI